ncbi:MAG TPA: di-trans,poly-cis-decaprenylcistransferase [Rhizomicrobium sp.]|nr:di-trans,poly-cis-decaprenylcistransferase [Rhizomicrobium sp.]
MTSTREDKLHVAIIMDGNGRWAGGRGLTRNQGHEAGIEALRRAVTASPGLGIGTLTVFAFSSDNWRRQEAEVNGLLELMRRYLDGETDNLVRDDVKLSVIGRRDRLSAALVGEIERAEAATEWGTTLHLRVAIDYSGREAIVTAAAAARGLPQLTAERFSSLVNGGANVGDVDLLIRTSGEQRLSDFMLWECAYAELYFTPRLWPDFGETDLKEALDAFRKRERRFGATPMMAAAE